MFMRRFLIGCGALAACSAGPALAGVGLHTTYLEGRTITTSSNLPVNIAGPAGLTVNGNVCFGALVPEAKLDVRGNLLLDNVGNPTLFTGRGTGELNRFLQLINSPTATSASGLKAGGILVSDSYAYANPGKNDLIVKGRVGIGIASPAMALDVNGGGLFRGNSLFLRNPSAPAGAQTWGWVVGTSNGLLSLGTAPDAPTVGGLSKSIMSIDRAAPSSSLSIAADGHVHVKVLAIDGGSDLSEQFDVAPADASTDIKPGMVVCIDPANAGKLVVSQRAYDRTVAGIISGADGIRPGMVMGQKGSIADGQHPIALTGRVWVTCDASNGAINAGDMLTTSDTPGHAMRVDELSKAQGAIIGKAMSSLANGGRGQVLVLVNLQ